MFVLSLLSKAALLSTDERVHQKIAMSRDFGDAMQKLFVEPSKPDETDRWNSITSPNLLRPWEGYTRMLGLSQPPTGFKALDLPDRLKRADSQLNDRITGEVKKVFTGTSDEMQSVEGQDTFRSGNVDFGAFDQLTGNDDPLTSFDAASFESDDSDHAVGGGPLKYVGKQVGKGVAEQVAKEVAKQNAKQVTREMIKQGVKEGVKEVAQEAAKQAAKNPLLTIAREGVKYFAGFFGIQIGSKFFNQNSDVSEIESDTAGRASGFVLNSEPQVIEALNLATGVSFNLNSDTDQSASELLVPGSTVSELNPKTDASQLLLA